MDNMKPVRWGVLSIPGRESVPDAITNMGIIDALFAATESGRTEPIFLPHLVS